MLCSASSGGVWSLQWSCNLLIESHLSTDFAQATLRAETGRSQRKSQQAAPPATGCADRSRRPRSRLFSASEFLPRGYRGLGVWFFTGLTRQAFSDLRCFLFSRFLFRRSSSPRGALSACPSFVSLARFGAFDTVAVSRPVFTSRIRSRLLAPFLPLRPVITSSPRFRLLVSLFKPRIF